MNFLPDLNQEYAIGNCSLKLLRQRQSRLYPQLMRQPEHPTISLAVNKYPGCNNLDISLLINMGNVLQAINDQIEIDINSNDANPINSTADNTYSNPALQLANEVLERVPGQNVLINQQLCQLKSAQYTVKAPEQFMSQDQAQVDVTEQINSINNKLQFWFIVKHSANITYIAYQIEILSQATNSFFKVKPQDEELLDFDQQTCPDTQTVHDQPAAILNSLNDAAYQTPCKVRRTSQDICDNLTTKSGNSDNLDDSNYSELDTKFASTYSKFRKPSGRKQSTGKKADKKNVVKNFVKAFLSHLQLPVSNVEISKMFGTEHQSEIQQIKDEIAQEQLNRKYFNNQLLNFFMEECKYSQLFRYFIQRHAESWLDNSLVQDKKTHRDVLQLYKLRAKSIDNGEKLSTSAKAN